MKRNKQYSVFPSNFLPIVIASIYDLQEQENSQKRLSGLLLNGIFETDIRSTEFEIASKKQFNTFFDSFEQLSLQEFREKGFHYRYDLAVITLEPSAILNEISDILVNCRDLTSKYVLVFAPISLNLCALGFIKVALQNGNEQALNIGTIEYTIWQFNLFDYKQLPDWFNSRFWANPENWNKFRW